MKHKLPFGSLYPILASRTTVVCLSTLYHPVDVASTCCIRYHPRCNSILFVVICSMWKHTKVVYQNCNMIMGGKWPHILHNAFNFGAGRAWVPWSCAIFCAYYLSISDRPLPRDWAVKAQMYFEPRSTSRASCSQLEPEAWSWTIASFFRHVMNGPKDHWISAPSFKKNLSFLPRLRACYKIEYPWFHFQHCVHSHFAPCRVKQRQKWCVLRTSGIQIPNSQEKSISW